MGRSPRGIRIQKPALLVATTTNIDGRTLRAETLLKVGENLVFVGLKLSDKQGQRQWDKLQAVWYLGSGIFSIPIFDD